MSAADWTRKVFRLRRLPDDVSTLPAVAGLLSRILALPDDHVVVYSVTIAPSVYAMPSRMATLQMKSIPAQLQHAMGDDEWMLSLPGENVSDILILDTHFESLTVLYDPAPVEHVADCIAISGLASHPFGSWQPHGPDKTFMWIRDAAHESLQGIRTSIYGYDSKLTDSKSFQSIGDIATKLILHLKSGGWNRHTSKPIVFLAHSLGGLVLIEAIVQIADSRDKSLSSILSNVRGAIMFGVPTLGMDQTHLMSMVEGQPNESLIQALSRDGGNDYIRQLHERFEGLSFLKKTRLFWAYETRQSRTMLQLKDGSWHKSGPYKVLVHPYSATSRRYGKDGLNSDLIPIDKDHSSMVKFGRGDSDLAVIAESIKEICNQVPLSDQPKSAENDDSAGETGSGHSRPGSGLLSQDYRERRMHPSLRVLGETLSALDTLQDEIYSPELDFRVNSIDDPFEDTFTWVFNLGIFTQWLQEGTGLFWIHGKPGSGKSTLMKLIFQSPVTQEFLHNWRGTSLEIVAGFFFHYRGSAIQKSLEGVLRSLILQILAPLRDPYMRYHRPTWAKYEVAMEQLSQQTANLSRAEGDLSGVSQMLKKVMEELSSLRVAEQDGHDLSARSAQHSVLQDSKHMQSYPPVGQTEQKRTLQVDINEKINILNDRQKTLEADEARCRQEISEAQDTIKSLKLDLKNREEKFKPYASAPESEFLNDVAAVFRDNKNSSGFMTRLERLLHQLLGQTVMDIDLVLFFDALDEFDGHDDTIGRFMKSLLSSSATSKTRIKVCMSSRPNPQLKAQFDSCLGFPIQDHTKSDIQEYAASSLPTSPDTNQANELLHRLVPIVIERANGVFLWVKLAIKVLLETAEKLSEAVSLGALEQKLEELPDDLLEFYEMIVERIPKSNRLRTFALLELLTRQSGQSGPPLTVSQTRNAALISDCKTFNEAVEELKRLNPQNRGQIPTLHYKGQIRDDIHTWGGGLVEIKVQHGVPRPQLMHQTVVEFTMGPWFKKVVVGRHLSTIVEGNGHSFYAKYLIAERAMAAAGLLPGDRGEIDNKIIGPYYIDTGYFTGDLKPWFMMMDEGPARRPYLSDLPGVERFMYHAVQSELTTGKSQYSFFSTIPYDELGIFEPRLCLQASKIPNYLFLLIINTLCLTLCLRDWVRENGKVHVGSSETMCPLLSSLFVFPLRRIFESRYVDMARLLLGSGFRISQDPDFFARLFAEIWTTRSSTEGNGTIVEYPTKRVPTAALLALAKLALDHGQNPNAKLTLFSRIGVPECTPLHIAPPSVARELIKHGADPQLESSQGLRPIHWILHHPEVFEGQNRLDCSQRYEMCNILARAGGITGNMRPPAGIAGTLAEFEMEGHDTAFIRWTFTEAGIDTEGDAAPTTPVEIQKQKWYEKLRPRKKASGSESGSSFRFRQE